MKLPLAISCCISVLALEGACRPESTATEYPKDEPSAAVDCSESVVAREVVLSKEPSSARLDLKRARDIAIRHFRSLQKGESFPKAVSSIPACSNRCFDIDARSLTGDCAHWQCRFSIGDPAHPVSGTVILIHVSDADVSVEPEGLGGCFSAAHGCEIGVSHREAMTRLGTNIDSDVGISWDSTRSEFFWENRATGERVRFHP